MVQVLSGLARTGHAVRTAGEILARSRAAGGPALPRWAEPMQLEPSVSLVTTDGFGDQTGVYVSFQGQSPTDRHVLIALIDHNLRGVVKELFVTDEVDELLEAVRSELGGDEVRQVEPAQALQLVAQALAATDAQPDRKELCGEETASHLPLAWARVRSAGVAAKPGPGSGAGPTEAELVQGTLDVLTGCALDGAAAMAATRFVTALAVDGGLPLRASPVAVLLALFDGVADQPWTDEELDGLQEALPVVTAHINRSSPLAQEIQGGLAEAWEDLWPEARRLLAAGHRLAPGRRGVMDVLLGEDDDADGDDDEDYDDGDDD